MFLVDNFLCRIKIQKIWKSEIEQHSKFLILFILLIDNTQQHSGSGKYQNMDEIKECETVKSQLGTISENFMLKKFVGLVV